MKQTGFIRQMFSDEHDRVSMKRGLAFLFALCFVACTGYSMYCKCIFDHSLAVMIMVIIVLLMGLGTISQIIQALTILKSAVLGAAKEQAVKESATAEPKEPAENSAT